jgi:autotransporter-associated beta strand protein
LALATLTFQNRASALIINLSFGSSVTSLSNAADVERAVNYTAAQFQNLYSDPVTLKFTVAATNTVGALGNSSTALEGFYSYGSIRNGLIADSKSAGDALAVGSLPVSDPSGGHQYATSSAQTKAMGITPVFTLPATDGTFTFGKNPTGSNNFPANYTFDPANRAVPGKIDFIGVAEHEISEMMGRIPGLGTNFGDGGPDFMPFDLFSFSAPGTRNMTTGAGRYFSVDNGATHLQNFNFPNGNGSDPQDWLGGTPDSYNAFGGAPNEMDPITPADVTAVDVIGYDLANLVWKGTASSTWDIFTTANWANSNGATTYTDSAQVVFDDTGSPAHTAIVLSQNVFTNSVTVNSSTLNYSFSGPGAITGLGGLTKAGSSVLTINNANTFSGPTIVNAGVLTLSSAGALASTTYTVAPGAIMNLNGTIPATSTITANGTVNFGGTTGGVALTRSLAQLNIGSNIISAVAPSSLPLTPMILAPTSLVFANSSAKLDLTNNELITTGTRATAKSLLTSGQIFSSAAGGVLGFADAGSGKYEIRFTVPGDADLSGVVDSGDFARLAMSFGSTGAFWDQGDFNGDGVVNALDFNLLASNFGQALASPVVSGAPNVLVPEPSTFALTLASCVLLRRRRK